MTWCSDRPASVDLYWLPLGAGDRHQFVRWSGRCYEALAAAVGRRDRAPLFHSLVEVHVEGKRRVIEMAPVWHRAEAARTVVCEGAVGLRWLRRSRFFRYGVRCSRDEDIPDLSRAVGGPTPLSENASRARAVLDLAPDFPTATWGLDELHTGEMWNLNSLTSWLLAAVATTSSWYARPRTAGRRDGQPDWSSPRDRRCPAGPDRLARSLRRRGRMRSWLLRAPADRSLTLNPRGASRCQQQNPHPPARPC